MQNCSVNQSALLSGFRTDLRHQYGISGRESQTSFFAFRTWWRERMKGGCIRRLSMWSLISHKCYYRACLPLLSLQRLVFKHLIIRLFVNFIRRWSKFHFLSHSQYHLAVPNLKKALMNNWQLIQNQPLLTKIYKESLLDPNATLKAKKNYICEQRGSCRPLTHFHLTSLNVFEYGVLPLSP